MKINYRLEEEYPVFEKGKSYEIISSDFFDEEDYCLLNIPNFKQAGAFFIPILKE